MKYGASFIVCRALLQEFGAKLIEDKDLFRDTCLSRIACRAHLIEYTALLSKCRALLIKYRALIIHCRVDFMECRALLRECRARLIEVRGH